MCVYMSLLTHTQPGTQKVTFHSMFIGYFVDLKILLDKPISSHALDGLPQQSSTNSMDQGGDVVKDREDRVQQVLETSLCTCVL